jgi:Fungal N-terminal domain of STAND proteins
MADPLSISASIVAVVCAFQASSKKLVEVIRDIRRSPAELLALSNETSELSIVFDTLQAACEKIEPVGKPREYLQTQLKSANNMLERLAEFLKHVDDTKRLGQVLRWHRGEKMAGELRLQLQILRMDLYASLTLISTTEVR